jgi:ABC-type histidine transport system ATPase subunit
MNESATPSAAIPAKSTAPVLRVHNVHKRFGATEVLKGIDLEVQEGEVVAIIGASGSGKTTFLRCVNLLEEYEQGEIAVGGETIGYRSERGRRRRLGGARSRPSAPASAWCSRASTCSRT